MKTDEKKLEPVTSRTLSVLGLILFIYVVVAVGRSTSTLPFVDEAWYAMPAWNLAVNGGMGTPVLETTASPMPDMQVSLFRARERTYWMLPLPIVVQAGWYKLWGFSLLSLRLFSVAWSLVALIALYSILISLTGNGLASALCLGLIAMDTTFVSAATLGRMDMMSAALGFGGLAVYLRLRQRNLRRAVWISHSLVVASGLSHPNGGIMSLAALAFVMIHLDRDRLTWPHLVLSLIPYAVGAIGMALYIAPDPEAFRKQFFGNSGGRFDAFREPLTALRLEITRRYLGVYGGNANLEGLHRLKLVIFVVYAAGFAGAVVSSKLRTKYRTLLLLTAVSCLTLTYLDNYKVQWYLIYTVPFIAAIAGVWLCSLRRLGVVAAALVVTLQLVAFGRHALQRRYQREYLPAVEFLREHTRPDTVVMASSEFCFDFGFHHLIDDIRLGYHSGIRPAMLVIDERYETAERAFQRSEPGVYTHILALREGMGEGFRNSAYVVYLRRTSGDQR